MKILNYYLDTISNYKMYFSINITDDFLILNFNGLDYIMKKFINDIVNKISFYSIQLNSLTPKYFDDIKHEIVENLMNFKYSSPYSLCLKYFSTILSKDFMPDEAIDFINNLTYDFFMDKLNKLLVFQKEYFVIIGNLKICPEPFVCDDDMTIKNAMEYVDNLTLNILRYKEEIYNDDDDTQKSLIDIDLTKKDFYEEIKYTLTKSQINSNEVNNCVLDCYLIKKYKLEIINSSIKTQQLKSIFKDKLIYEFISDLINEPLFDKIRTIDKMGYIVKSILKYHTHLDNGILFLCYVVQSNYPIDNIYASIDEFNINFYKNFQKNTKKFKKMFVTLKKSKLLELKKKTF
jgi:insulysin